MPPSLLPDEKHLFLWTCLESALKNGGKIDYGVVAAAHKLTTKSANGRFHRLKTELTAAATSTGEDDDDNHTDDGAGKPKLKAKPKAKAKPKGKQAAGPAPTENNDDDGMAAETVKSKPKRKAASTSKGMEATDGDGGEANETVKAKPKRKATGTAKAKSAPKAKKLKVGGTDDAHGGDEGAASAEKGMGDEHVDEEEK